MTEEQKEQLISKMIDCPSELTGEELAVISGDEELIDLYEISSKLCGAYHSQPEIDMDSEWAKMRLRINRRGRRVSLLMRIAAILVGIALVSVCFIKFSDRSDPMISLTAQTPSTKEVEVVEADINAEKGNKGGVVPCESAPEKTSTPTNIRSKAKSKAQPPKPEAECLDIDQYLRLQKARVDNDLALQKAEMYIEEYEAIIPLLVALGENEENLDKNLQKLTMQ